MKRYFTIEVSQGRNVEQINFHASEYLNSKNMISCGEIRVDERAAEGVLLIRVKPYFIIILGLAFLIGSSVGLVRCFAPFDDVPYDKVCLDRDGTSAFVPLVLVFFAGLIVIFFLTSWDDFLFDRNAGVLKVTRRRPLRKTDEETMDLRNIMEVKVEKSDRYGGTSRVELKADRFTVPLTWWYSSDPSEQHRAAVAIERFLGLESRNEDRGLQCASCRNRRQESRRMMHASDVEAPSRDTDKAGSANVNVAAVPVQGGECAKLLPMAVATPAAADDDAVQRGISVSKALPV